MGGLARFRPALWPTLVSVPALAVLLALGTWQIERLHWKEALIAAREASLAAPPAALGAGAQGLDELAELDFRRVSVRGRFRHQAEIHLVAPSLRGEACYHVVTPLARGGGERVVLVDRGWVPPALKLAASRPRGQVAGTVTVEGIARAQGAQGMFVPDNDPGKNLWYWRDLTGMAAHLGLALAPVLVEAGAAANPGGWPLGGQTRTELRNDHLGYALIWYALAAALVVVYVLYHRGRAAGAGP